MADKIEMFDGKCAVVRTRIDAARFFLEWQRDDHAQAIILRGEDLSRAVAGQIAAGADPIARALRVSVRQKAAGATAGRASWAGLTAKQRSDRARKIALAGWTGKRKGQRVTS